MKTILFALVLSLLVVAMPLADQPNYKGHAISMYGDLKYGPDFKHFDYANPNAPKGGTVKRSAGGTYDCLNQFILKGVSAYGLGLIYDSLTERSLDEPFSEYGLLAESIEVPPDRSWTLFTLRSGARWHDGKPITPEDVVFTFETIQTKGHPFYRNYYADIKQIEKVGERQVKFTFGGKDNRELPLIVGQMAILPKHYWEGKNFEETTLEPPLGSGPYKIEAYEPGRSITYRRVENYWGTDLSIKKGRYNPDVIHYDYYKDGTVATEAQKGGEFDFALQNNSKSWATAYDIPAVAEGRLIKELIPHENGTGMQGFWFNTRRSKFADPKVRHALAHAFDFEWTNTNLFYGQYARSTSYFSNTELASSGLPQGQELEILEAFRGQIPEEVFTSEYKPPTTDGSGNIRQNLRVATRMLKAAGWSVKEGKLTNDASGKTMIIEFLINNSPSWERIVGPYIQNLERLGVEAAIKIVDTSQYQNRVQEYDFDAIVSLRGQSLSPGNEQRGYWTSAAADEPGTRNYAGIKDPVVDALVDQLINAPDRKALVSTTRALDRVLLWGHYVVPHWHIRAHRVVYWNKFGKPDISPRYLPQPWQYFPDTWWVDATKEAALKKN
ncbi:MAG: ABC transporter substrate-binding protein [Gemmatimonadetes bacterium]|nr:ABC transporter substrate-binding protein [Gemmatimonadota bacterium]MYK51483.1 ABC transporter substrate-binding protein [Gemmatimonadota bacterium]